MTSPAQLSAVVVGVGATGARVAELLVADPRVGSVQVHDTDSQRLDQVLQRHGGARGLSGLSGVSGLSGLSGPIRAAHWGRGNGEGLMLPQGTDVVVLATAAGSQTALARRAVEAEAAVVAVTDEIGEVRELLALDSQARRSGVPVVVGAGYMPGLTCLLARLGAAEFDSVDEIHVAKAGTGGPACARQHHRALSGLALDWRDGHWRRRAGGSGRELCWFPDPVAGRDCYRAALPDALLLAPEFPEADRVTARMAATRRDRFTAPLPMLRQPHPEGGMGAVRVELRGRREGARHVVVLGSTEVPAVAAAIVAASAAVHVATHAQEPKASGLASISGTEALLQTVTAHGLRPFRFEGFALARGTPVPASGPDAPKP